METKTLRDEKQKEAINNWARAGFIGTVIAGTGFGKSRVGVVAVGEMLRRNRLYNALILVPTHILKDQFKEEFIKWGYNDILENVEFMCYQSAYKLINNKYNIVVCDEVHLGLSKEYRKFFKQNTYDYLLCISATAPEEKEYKFYLDTLAPTVFEISLDECVKLGFVAPYKINCVAVKLRSDEQLLYNKANKSFVNWKYKLGQYDAFNEDTRIMANKNSHPEEKKKAIMFYRAIRNRKDVVDNAANKLLLLKDIIERQYGKKVLTFGGSNEFTNKMCDAINGVSYHSGIPKKTRDLNLEMFKTGEVTVLCSTKALNQGLNIPDAEIGIICGLTSKSLTMIQRVGRLLRLKKGEHGISLPAQIFIIYVKDSQEEKWLKNAVGNLDNVAGINV